MWGKDGIKSIYLVARKGWQECIYKDRLRLFIWWQGWGWQVFIWWQGWDEKDSPCNFPSYPGVWGKPPVPQIIPGGDGGNPPPLFPGGLVLGRQTGKQSQKLSSYLRIIAAKQSGMLSQEISGGPWPDDRQQTQQVRGVASLSYRVYSVICI
jgi:hypothetical protein